MHNVEDLNVRNICIPANILKALNFLPCRFPLPDEVNFGFSLRKRNIYDSPQKENL